MNGPSHAPAQAPAQAHKGEQSSVNKPLAMMFEERFGLRINAPQPARIIPHVREQVGKVVGATKKVGATVGKVAFGSFVAWKLAHGIVV
jgi:hypothetical protein